MPRIVPSDVIRYIDRAFPEVNWNEPDPVLPPLDRRWVVIVDTIVQLTQQVPEELLPVSSQEYIGYLSSIIPLQEAVLTWRQVAQASPSLTVYAFLSEIHPIVRLRRSLSSCPDAVPAPGTTELAFITDEQLRSGLRLDVSNFNRSLANAEWKATTVIAGSVIEALLLWSIRGKSEADLFAALRNLTAQRPGGKDFRTAGWKSSQVPTPAIQPVLDNQDLNWFTEMALELTLITPETATLVRVVREFRNLIHPGRVARLSQECDRGTAYAAIAAYERVVRDIS